MDPNHNVGTNESPTVLVDVDPSFSNIMTNKQKEDWFLRLDPNGNESGVVVVEEPRES